MAMSIEDVKEAEKLNVLQVRSAEGTQQVWHAATTFQALDAALGG